MSQLFPSAENNSNFLCQLGHEKLIAKAFWTAKQRQSSSLHEVPYRACFKAEVPNYFITNLTSQKHIVYDPFAGRGTTGIEAGLLNRIPILNDINPISRIISEPRLFIPKPNLVAERLAQIFSKSKVENFEPELDMFFHADTERELWTLKAYFKTSLDAIDKWIRFVATTRLTGHSKGYFSVYTLPPNQAVSKKRQLKINEKLNQSPEYRNTGAIILRKTQQLLRKLTYRQVENLNSINQESLFLNKNAYDTPEIPSDHVDLIVTSPPFLNLVQYANDNWLRCWFNNIDLQKVEREITSLKNIAEWNVFIKKTLRELYRVLKKDKYLAFEVGEVKNGKVKLDEEVLPIAKEVGFKCESILINTQSFTKTANIWGIKNNTKGTNTNRILLLKK